MSSRHRRLLLRNPTIQRSRRHWDCTARLRTSLRTWGRHRRENRGIETKWSGASRDSCVAGRQGEYARITFNPDPETDPARRVHTTSTGIRSGARAHGAETTPAPFKSPSR